MNTNQLLKGGQGRPAPTIESVFSGGILWLLALAFLILFLYITN